MKNIDYEIDNKRRVVITGIGIISSVGIGKDNFWKSLISGKSGVGKITHFDPSNFTTQIAAEVNDFNPENWLNKKQIRRMDRFTQFAVSAAKMACDDANLVIDKDKDNFDIGASIASGIGGAETWEQQHKRLIEMGPDRVSPFFIPMLIINMASSQISLHFKIRGPIISATTACSASANSIGDAFEVIRRKKAKIMLAGGSEAAITPMAVAGFCNMRALSTRNDEPKKACRPFDIDRDGFVMGEGAGVLILEDLEHAVERKANIYAEVIGYGMTGDAYHITAMDMSGKSVAKAIEFSLLDAGININEVDYINAHGTSTKMNDVAETKAIKLALKENSKKVMVSSTKSMTGHCLGAAGAVEIAACALAIKNKIVPPTINLDNPDPECDLDYVPHFARKHDVKVALSNSMGFGGHNVAMTLKKI
ncbi:MAG: beta-ketoacyl-ACP synthase II [Actinobacteria bacterium]|nr:beta-ketoacyl-ACP synthase II [Actinomycetota bacterium]